MRLVSIIIPVYNVSDYLSECLDSVLSQTYKNIEIIIVNDGSTDNSGEVCEKYKIKDSRIKVIHKENGGVSSARNKALEMVSGEYIIFIDSDDVVASKYVEKMVKGINNSDLCVCGYYSFFLNNNIENVIINESNVIDKEKAIQMIYSYDSYGGYLWNKIFKNNIIKKNKLKFDENIHMCEDQLFVIEYLLKSSNINLISECLYYYRMRKSSIVWSKNNSKLLTIFTAYSKISKLLNDNNLLPVEFYKNIYLAIYKYKKNIDNQKLKKNLGITKKELRRKIFLSKQITNKTKIKIIIMKYTPIIYKIYMYKKLNKYIRFK